MLYSINQISSVCKSFFIIVLLTVFSFSSDDTNDNIDIGINKGRINLGWSVVTDRASVIEISESDLQGILHTRRDTSDFSKSKNRPSEESDQSNTPGILTLIIDDQKIALSAIKPPQTLMIRSL